MKAKRDLQASIDELTKVRNLIEEEKLPLARKVTVKRDKAKELKDSLNTISVLGTIGKQAFFN